MTPDGGSVTLKQKVKVRVPEEPFFGFLVRLWVLVSNSAWFLFFVLEPRWLRWRGAFHSDTHQSNPLSGTKTPKVRTPDAWDQYLYLRYEGGAPGYLVTEVAVRWWPKWFAWICLTPVRDGETVRVGIGKERAFFSFISRGHCRGVFVDELRAERLYHGGATQFFRVPKPGELSVAIRLNEPQYKHHL